MAVTLTSTGITFSDGNSQNTAASGGASTSSEQVFNSSGTWNKPSNCIGAFAVCGGGGGGGGHRGPDNPQTLPGGPGGLAASYLSLSTLNASSYPVGVGSGGNGQVWFQSGAAPSGGSSNFGGFVTGGGGNGGRGANPNQANPSTGFSGFAGNAINAGVGGPLSTEMVNPNSPSSVKSQVYNQSNYVGQGGTGRPSTQPGFSGGAGKVRVITIG